MAGPGLLLEQLLQKGRDLLGVRVPVLCGAMTWLSTAPLVAAISEAGGFGVLAGGNMPPDLLVREIEATRGLTGKPFGLNLITIAPNFKQHLDQALESRFPVIILAGGLPSKEAMFRVKEAGSTLICFAPTVGIARRLIIMGADALIIEGHEAGGHVGPVATGVLAEQILPHTTEVPVFVAGGIGSGLQVAHYLLMGAAGVQLGTSFAVAEESPAHINFKKALIRADAKDALPTSQFDPRLPVIPVRALVNEGVRDFNTLQLGLIAQLERGQISRQEAALKLEEFWIGGLRRAAVDGDVVRGSVMVGQSVGLVKKIRPAAEILRVLLEEAEREIARISRMCSG
jgi:enoyl-[acyl-carrier protein] reductase II